VEIACPKCGKKGRVRVIKQKKIQNIYRYVVVDHGNTKHSVDKEVMVDIIGRLLDENYELKTRIARLEEENAELRERIAKLQDENVMLKQKAEKYDEMMNHSVLVVNVDDLERLKKMMEEKKIDMLRVVAYRTVAKLEYVDIK